MATTEEKSRERGAALLLSFLAILVLAVVVGQIIVSASVDQSIALNSLNELKYDYAARGGLEQGKALLIRDLQDEEAESGAEEGGGEDSGLGLGQATGGPGEEGQAPIDALVDAWADEGETGQQMGEGVDVRLRIIDEDRKFNLLSLASSNEEFAELSKERFTRLLDTFREDTKHDLSYGEATDLAERFGEWLRGERESDLPLPAQSTAEKTGESSMVFGESGFSQDVEAEVFFPFGLDELVHVDGMSEFILHGYMDREEYIPGLEDVATVFSNLAFDQAAYEGGADGEEESFNNPFETQGGGDDENEDEDEGDGSEDGGEGLQIGDDGLVQATETNQGRININTAPMVVLRSVMPEEDVPYSVLEKIDEYRFKAFDEDLVEDFAGFGEDDEEKDNSEDSGSPGSAFEETKEDFLFRSPDEVVGKVEEYFGIQFGLSEDAEQELAAAIDVKSHVFTVILEMRDQKAGAMGEVFGEYSPPDRMYRAVVWRRSLGSGKYQVITLVPLHPWTGVVPPDTEDYKEEHPFGF